MLFQELGKLKRSSIMSSIILAAVGIVMIMCPRQYVDALVSVLGFGMVIAAVVWVLDFMAGKKALINYICLTGALLVGLLGLAVLNLDNVVRYVGVIFGLYLVGDGVIGISNAWVYARRSGQKSWRVLVVLSALMVVFGLIVLVNPWWHEPTLLFDVIGGMLLFSSVVSIIRLIYLWPIKGE